jgi:hypothetical protein
VLGDTDQRDLVMLENLDEPGEVGQGSREPVDAVAHHRIDLSGFDVA